MAPRFPSDDLLVGRQFCGAFIDDSGTPGIQAASPYLDSSRKTWVAVLFSAEQLGTVYREFPGTVKELHRLLGVRDFHAADLLSGKGSLRSVPLATRFSVFEFLAHIFATYGFPLLVQTTSLQTIADHSDTFDQLGTIGPFDFTSPHDAGLLLLLLQVKQYLQSTNAQYSAPCLFVVDEGRMKADAFIHLPTIADFAVGGGIFFRESLSTFPLQLADFAAFALNRMQWLLAKEYRNDREKAELRILDRAKFNWLNIPRVSVDLSRWKGSDYDRFYENDRIAKRLSILDAEADSSTK